MTTRRPAVAARTYPLGVGTFAVGSSTYCIAGLVPDLSEQLSISPSRAGQLVTVFAWTCVISGPLWTSMTQRCERRRLLVAALLLTAFGSAGACLAPTYGWLVVARIVTAMGTAVYTPAAITMAAELNPPALRARATAVVFGGLTLALVVGVPMATAFSLRVGFRGVFWALVMLCMVAAACVDIVVPQSAAPPLRPPRERVAGARDPRVRTVLGIAALASTSMFAVYTYLAPLLSSTAGPHGTVLSLLLAGYGVGAAAGNVIGGRMADHFGSRRPTLVALIACLVLLLALPVAAGTGGVVAVALALWGCAFWSINAPLSRWLVELSPANSGLLLSLNMSAIYVGMGLGGLVGGLLVACVGVAWLAPLSAIITAAALAMLLRTTSHERKSKRSPADPAVSTHSGKH